MLYKIYSHSNVDEKYKCYLSNDICVGRIIYNNRDYYSLYSNTEKYEDIAIRNSNSFYLGFYELDGILYTIVQESKKNINIRGMCKKKNEPFGFPMEDYQLKLYKVEKIKEIFHIGEVSLINQPLIIKQWFNKHYLISDLVFIC